MRRGPFAYLSEPVALPDSFRGGRPRAVMQNYVHDNHHFLPFVNGCVHIVHTGRKRLLLLWNIFVNFALVTVPRWLRPRVGIRNTRMITLI